jgi:hypothetical protein
MSLMKVDQEVLQQAATALFRDLGTIDDLGQELSNTVANIYYRFHLVAKNIEDPSAGLDVQVDYKYIAELVRSMRGTREESKSERLFDYLVTLTLDTCKYRIPDADKKTPIRRAFARRFQKVREIDGLYRQMLSCRQRTDEVIA